MEIQFLTVVVLVLTAIVILCYTIETHRLRTETEKGNLFATLTAVRQALNDSKRYDLRKYLHERFDEAFEAALEEAMGGSAIGVGGLPNMQQVEGQRGNEGFHNRLHTKLETKPFSGSHSALETVEETLLSFNSLSVPVYLGLEHAFEAAKSYKPLFEATAPHILPFVAVGGTVRDDPTYKREYLCMLSRLGILDRLRESQPDMAPLVHHIERRFRYERK